MIASHPCPPGWKLSNKKCQSAEFCRRATKSARRRSRWNHRRRRPGRTKKPLLTSLDEACQPLPTRRSCTRPVIPFMRAKPTWSPQTPWCVTADVPFVSSSDHFGQPCDRSSHLTGDQNASLTLVLHNMVFTRDRSGLSFVLVV
jgi:hypothetical protein